MLGTNHDHETNPTAKMKPTMKLTQISKPTDILNLTQTSKTIGLLTIIVKTPTMNLTPISKPAETLNLTQDSQKGLKTNLTPTTKQLRQEN